MGVSDRALRAVGLVAISSAELDMSVRALLMALIGSQRGGLLAAGMSFSQMDQAIAGLSKNYLAAEPRAKVGSLLTRARDLHGERDTVIHGWWLPKDVNEMWAGNGDVTEHYVVRPRRWKDTLAGRAYTEHSLEELAMNLEDLGREIDDLVPEIPDALIPADLAQPIELQP